MPVWRSGSGMKGKDLHTLNMDELTETVNRYPWFGAARKELCVRMSKMGGSEWGKEQYADAAMYIPSRKMVSDIVRSLRKEDYSDKDVERLLKTCIEPARPAEGGTGYRRTVRVAGGDFFSQDQYDGVRRDEDNIFSRFAAAPPEDPAEKRWEDPELGFCTETLARIYAEQGYAAQAKKIYSRLVLRYPEKSAYFASLIEKFGQEK